jgi:hypothetical protein
MDTHLSNPGSGAPSGGPRGDRGNEAVGLKAYLDGVAARMKTVPAAWVRCELLTLKLVGKYVRMEFVEHDANSTASWASIPRHRGQRFHGMMGTDSTGSWAPG